VNVADEPKSAKEAFARAEWFARAVEEMEKEAASKSDAHIALEFIADGIFTPEESVEAVHDLRNTLRALAAGARRAAVQARAKAAESENELPRNPAS
jgi:hypothetical protein